MVTERRPRGQRSADKAVALELFQKPEEPVVAEELGLLELSVAIEELERCAWRFDEQLEQLPLRSWQGFALLGEPAERCGEVRKLGYVDIEVSCSDGAPGLACSHPRLA